MTTYGFFSKEVAIQLEINPNTLRRWSIELEKYGYEFTRNEKDQRIYYDRDLVALTDFKKMLHRT
jgi:transposase-like protein